MGNAIKIDDVGSGMLLGSMGPVFHRKKGYITSCSMYVTMHLVIYVGGRQEWVDGSGYYGAVRLLTTTFVQPK